MNKYYKYITVHGITSLFEIHYEMTDTVDWVHVYNWFDRHGDSPDLSDYQVQMISQEISEFEQQRPLGVPEQQRLSTEFNGLAA